MTIRENKGFLLIEVLVTVLIVSVSIVLINQAFNSSLRATGLSNDYLQAMLLLEDRIFDFETNSVLGNDKDSGEEEYEGRKFHWESEVLPLESEEAGEGYDDADLGIEKASLSVAWIRHEVERRIELLTYTREREAEE